MSWSAKAGGDSGIRGRITISNSAQTANEKATAAETRDGGGSGSGEATQGHLGDGEDVLMDAQPTTPSDFPVSGAGGA